MNRTHEILKNTQSVARDRQVFRLPRNENQKAKRRNKTHQSKTLTSHSLVLWCMFRRMNSIKYQHVSFLRSDRGTHACGGSPRRSGDIRKIHALEEGIYRKARRPPALLAIACSMMHDEWPTLMPVCIARTFPSLTSTHRAQASRSRSSALSFSCSPNRPRAQKTASWRWTGRGEE